MPTYSSYATIYATSADHMTSARRITALLLIPALLPLGSAAQDSHSGKEVVSVQAEFEAWAADRINRLKAEDGWLTLAGLFWLRDGDNSFGSAADSDLLFPESAPAHIGVFTLRAGEVSLVVEPEAGVIGRDSKGGAAPVRVRHFPSLSASDPDALELGSLRFYPIERSGRFAVRLKDVDSAARVEFTGIERFSWSERWRIEGSFEAFEESRTIMVPTVIGTPAQTPWPRMVRFEVAGEEYRLAVFGDTVEDSWSIFADRTNGQQTYGGGRFLVLEDLGSGRVMLDFNKAYNPPCVFTPYATCPLPPARNRLPIRVEAGEKTSAGH